MKNIKKLFLAFILGVAILVPIQVNAATPRREPRVYFYNPDTDVAVKYGIKQYRIKELCPSPAVFSWYDNGIPVDAMGHYATNSLDFKTDRIKDRGYGTLDSGLHFHKFGAVLNDGREVDFWACVDQRTKNCDGCLGKLLNPLKY